MLKLNSKTYQEIRAYLDTVPVIETHEHYLGNTEPVDDIFDFLLASYSISDFQSATFRMEKDFDGLMNKKLSFEKRYDIFERAYKRTNNTAYIKAVEAGLDACWGIKEVNKRTIRELSEKMKKRGQGFYSKMMDKFKIRAKIVDIYDVDNFMKVIKGENKNYSGYCRFAFPLPKFHDIHRHWDIHWLEINTGNRIKTLDDYISSFEILLKKALDFGVICMKDQSAYRRAMDYGYPGKAAAEEIFNKIIYNPSDIFGTAEAEDLDDWLFNYFLELAVKHNLPVQVHTGHLAGIGGDIARANASHLLKTLELHKNVAFDLFHGNWPFMDEYLFIGKNYPNVFLDLCWVQSIDPVYCIELMKRALVTVPHIKLMAFGGDTGSIENTVGYLILARDNVACALSEMVDMGWISMDDAKQIARDWFFNNPNEFFKLNLKYS